MARRYSSNSSGNMINIVMIIIIALVLGLGVFAVWDRVSTGIRQNQINNGGEYTVAEVADQNGMEVSDFLEYYGITDADGINEKSSISEMTDKLTLEKYVELNFGSFTEDDFNTFKAEQGLGDDVTKDTKDSDVKMQYASYLYQKQMAESATETADSTDGVTVDTVTDTTTDGTAAVEAESATESAEAESATETAE